MKNSRRKFLQHAGLSTAMMSGPLGQFVMNLVSSASLRAQDELPASNYLVFYLREGIPRWVYDAGLIPKPGASFKEDPFIFTKVVDGIGRYSTLDLHGHKVPPLWGAKIPTTNGSSVPSSILLQNMLTIRGIDMSNNSHSGCADALHQPEPGKNTLAGLVADKSTRNLPAVSTHSHRYSAASGARPLVTSVSASNPIEEILGPFKTDPLAFLSRPEVDGIIDQALHRMWTKIDPRDLKLRSLKGEREKAKKMFHFYSDSLLSSWGPLKSKYQGLISKVLLDSEYQIGEGIDSGSFLVADHSSMERRLRYKVDADRFIPQGQSLKAALGNGSTIGQMAESFALAEFLMSEGLSSYFMTGIGHLQGLGMGIPRIFNDAHQVGSYAHLFYFSKYFQALNACLYEFISQLKKKNIFNETLIQVCSEMGRLPNRGLNGSNHGGSGNHLTFMSGKIKSYQIGGNISAGKQSGTFGTWGHGAGVNGESRPANISDVVVSLSNALGVKTSLSNGRTLLFEDSGGLKVGQGGENV